MAGPSLTDEFIANDRKKDLTKLICRVRFRKLLVATHANQIHSFCQPRSNEDPNIEYLAQI